MREKRKTLLILYKIEKKILCDIAVVPLAGTWIEISLSSHVQTDLIVVPLAGTWIEICENKIFVGIR